jgi:hypothetical protein
VLRAVTCTLGRASFGSPFGSHVHMTSEMPKRSSSSAAASTSKRFPVARPRIPSIYAVAPPL